MRCGSYEAAVTVLYVFSPVTVAAFGAAPVVFEPMVLAPVGRDRLLADTKAFAAAESASGVAIKYAISMAQEAGAHLNRIQPPDPSQRRGTRCVVNSVSGDRWNLQPVTRVA